MTKEDVNRLGTIRGLIRVAVAEFEACDDADMAWAPLALLKEAGRLLDRILLAQRKPPRLAPVIELSSQMGLRIGGTDAYPSRPNSAPELRPEAVGR